jgi:hypothetical protein
LTKGFAEFASPGSEHSPVGFSGDMCGGKTPLGRQTCKPKACALQAAAETTLKINIFKVR